MKKILIFTIVFFGLLCAFNASAGIIIRPVLNTGLVGYWSFNEGAGTKVGDMSGNGQHCTWAGSGSHWGDGKFGNGGRVTPALDDEATCGTNNIYNLTGNFTISFWAKLLTVGTDTYFVVAGRADTSYYLDAGEKGYYLMVRRNSDEVYFDFNIGGASAKADVMVTAPDDGLWHHIIGVRNGTSFKVYLDGVFSGEDTATLGDMSASGQTLYVGANDNGDSNVGIDEVRIYNRDLDESEIIKLYDSGASRIGMNKLGLVPDDLPANATISYVREDCAGYSPCYTTLASWESNFGGIDFANHSCSNGDLTCLGMTAVARIDGTWNSPNGAVTINGWTTDASNYIHIYTTASARHPGKWDETKYRIENSAFASSIDIYSKDVWIDGLQFKHVRNSSTAYTINIETTTGGTIKISNNIFWGDFSGSCSAARGIDHSSPTGITEKIWNNIFYGYKSPGGSDRAICHCAYGAAYIYNNTVYDSTRGFYSPGATYENVTLKNNLVQATSDGYSGTFASDSDYNISNISGDAPGSNSRNSTTANFVDATNKDFHLLPSDTGARNWGADLSNDATISFQFDIDRQARKGTWDIGADEARGTVTGASQANQITNGLVGYWPFNGPDIDGNLAYDRSAGGNNGTITGSAALIDGKVGQGINFDGADDFVNLGTGLNQQVVTVTVWVKPNTMASIKSVLSKARVYEMDIADGANYLSCYIGNGTNWATSHAHTASSYTVGSWTFFACVYDGTNLTAYQDGIPGTTVQPEYSPPGSSSNGIAIGRYGGGSYYFNGTIDEVRIYNRALEPEEIQRLYNLGR
jgi:hypothetical protein